MDRSQSEASNVLALEAQSRAAARAAGLRYTDDRRPGIRRERHRKAFHYIDPRGRRISDPQLLVRLRALAIPPAWTDVWICPHEHGHLQATGRDARGRKQYRYHPRWSEVRDAAKHGRMCEFARRLDDVRAHCKAMLRTRGLTRSKLMAALLRIVDLTAIRVGHEEYTRDNDSFGLTTLRTRHARVRGATVQLRFRGKSGIERTITFRDPTLAKLIVACRALGGPRLFQYRDARGAVRGIDATQLNAYLKALIGGEFSIKDFRTWSATVCVAVEVAAQKAATSQRAAKKQLLEAIRTASGHLGNTPAICRKSYIHPLIMDAYLIGKTLPNTRITDILPGGVGYQAHEASVRRFLMRLIRESDRKSTPQSRVAWKQAS